MTIEEIKKNAPKPPSKKLKLTKEELSKIGLAKVNAYKFKRKLRNTTFIEL